MPIQEGKSVQSSGSKPAIELDPLAKTLFERLPIPQAKGQQATVSLTAALKEGNSGGPSLIKVKTNEFKKPQSRDLDADNDEFS